MPIRNRRHRLIRAVIWTAVCFGIGALIFFTVAAVMVGDPNPSQSKEAVQFAELSVHVVFGLLALVCLPFVLFLDGRTVPRSTLSPKVLAAEKLRTFLADSGRGGESFLDRDGSVEALQRRTGGWIPITLGLVGIFVGMISSFGVAAASVLVISLSARRSWVLSGAALATATLALAASYVLTPVSLGGFDLPIFIVNSVFISILIVIGVIRGAREQGLIDTAAQTLLRDRSRQDRAIAEVRRSIARDMHDSLSHHLSVIAMYAGALSVRQDLDPDAVRESAKLIAASARRSGVELREVLTMLRGDDQGTVIDPDLQRLVSGRTDTVDLVYQAPLSAQALERLGGLERTTVYRFVQEAITNAVKHAPGQRVTITVAADGSPEALVLTARNPLGSASAGAGKLPPQLSPVAGAGLGLLGLRERMEAMGGQLTVERGSEFVLRARIPAAGLPTDPAESPTDPAGSPTDDAREPTDAADVQAKTSEDVTLPDRPAADPTEERT
ncbi:sensor histidine kinase [Brevibacterium metallidurans]|uniref:sensor histidine kinase n=1 Tax=Brevibacterium metallidurans TaxID=1482676 RepID=UPI0030D9F6FD